MKRNETVEKNIKFLEELSKDGITIDVKICPQCKSALLAMMDVVGMYSPLSPARHVCKKCGWVGRTNIVMTNRRIDELDEDMLEDIIDMLSKDEKK